MTLALAVAVAACEEEADDPEATSAADASSEGSGSETSAPAEEGSSGAAPECPPELVLPEPLDPCLEGCGNELQVGRPCSAGGGECTSDDFNNATLCTLDFVPEAPLNQCTKPCVANDQCGTGAFCQGDPEEPDGPKGCVPIACDPEGYEMSMMGS